MNITDFYSQSFNSNTAYNKPTIEEIAQKVANTAAESVKEEYEQECGNKDFEEKDPEFTSSAASKITDDDINNWNNKQDKISQLKDITDAVSLAESALQPGDIDFSYDENNKQIVLIIDGTKKGIDATNFIKDGMLESAELNGTELILSFNTDAGHKSIPVDLGSLVDVDLSNYYTKNEVDQAIGDIVIPQVPEWALAQEKPQYTAQEVGALSNDVVIPTVPTNVSDFTNDAGYLTTETDPTVPAWAKEPNKPTYTAQEVGALPNDTVIPSLDGYATMEDIVNYCPTIEDTRNGNSSDITGVAPFETLEDGQRIILHLTYATEPNSTLNLTLSDGTTTGAKDVKYQVPNTVLPQPISEKYGKYMPNRYVEMTYDKPKKHWVCMTAVNAVNKFKTVNNETILGEGNISFTETEPQFNASAAKDITTEDVNAWNNKQDLLTFDEQPMEDSDNPVKSKGIKSYVDTQVAEIVNGANVDFDSLGEAQQKYNELNTKYIALHNVVYGMADGAAATEMNPEYVANTISSGNRNVVVEKGELGDVTIPEVTGSTTVTAPMEDGAVVTLTTPNKSFTLTNTNESENPVSVTVNAPYNDNSTSNTTLYLQGEYENITVENASIGKASDREAPVVHNITVNNNVDEDVENPKMKNSTIAATFTGDDQNPSVVTSNVPALTITNYNTAVDENDEPLTPPSLMIDAEETSVTLNSKWDVVEAVVSPNTLFVNGSAHINKLICAQRVEVKVSKASKIDEVISDYTGVNVDYTKVDITNSNQSKMTNTAECTLQEDITKTYGWSFGAISSDYPVWKLNGHNITIQKERVGAVLLRSKACLDIYGPGTITSQDYGVWTGSEDNVVNVYGGDFACTDHALYSEKGTINVYGGTFRVTGDDKRFVLNCFDANYTAGTAHINVYGGKFYDFDPSNSMSEPNGPVNFVAPGYHVVQGTDETGNYYEVVAD